VQDSDITGAKGQSWCLVSHHKVGSAPTILFGDSLAVLGIAPENFSEEALEASMVSVNEARVWREATEVAFFLACATTAQARWIEASSVVHNGGLLVSLRPAQLGDYEEFVARARLSLGGSLLGPMAHELNNLVQGISSAEYLFRDCLENGDAIEMEDVDQLAEAVVGLKGMGAQLQSFARLSFQDAESVSVPRIITRAAKFLRSLGRMGIVEFTNSVPDDLPDVHWRATELDFVVLALLANAVDGSLVEGQDPSVLVRAHVAEDTIEIEFANSGPPIDLPKAAIPGSTTKAPSRHLGLGLSAVMAILAKRGGSVTQVAADTGSLLRLVLPLRATL